MIWTYVKYSVTQIYLSKYTKTERVKSHIFLTLLVALNVGPLGRNGLNFIDVWKSIIESKITKTSAFWSVFEKVYLKFIFSFILDRPLWKFEHICNNKIVKNRIFECMIFVFGASYSNFSCFPLFLAPTTSLQTSIKCKPFQVRVRMITFCDK